MNSITLQAPDAPIEISREGDSLAAMKVRVMLTSNVPDRRRQEAIRRLLELAGSKPSAGPGDGITDELRRLRDDGDSF